jgi:phthiocerol/phenolphthiocerol synthesis type-I polyketide synthase C
MAGRGAKYILALSRRGAEDNPEVLKFIREIEAIGALVWAPACDTTDNAALKRVLEVCSQRYPPIK